jgi:hypothetical protein
MPDDVEDHYTNWKMQIIKPGGRSVTLIALPAYVHDPEVRFGEVQILIL